MLPTEANGKHASSSNESGRMILRSRKQKQSNSNEGNMANPMSGRESQDNDKLPPELPDEIERSRNEPTEGNVDMTGDQLVENSGSDSVSYCASNFGSDSESEAPSETASNEGEFVVEKIVSHKGKVNKVSVLHKHLRFVRLHKRPFFL